jgi:hypothetical protein
LILFYVFYSLAIVVMLAMSKNLLVQLESWLKCPADEGQACFGAASIFRMSFVLTSFYILMMLMMFCKDKVSMKINTGGWIIKFLMVLGGFVGCLFLPNEIFTVYARIATYVGISYLIFQDLAYNEFFLRWSYGWIYKARFNFCYKLLVGLACLISLAMAIAVMGVNYYWYWLPGCTLNKAILIINPVFGTIFLVLSFLRFRKDVSPISASMTIVYTSFWFWSGMGNNSDPLCNPHTRSELY